MAQPAIVLVDTRDAVTYILGANPSPRERQLTQQRIYGAAQRGQLKRYGGATRGTAKWDLREIDALLHRYDMTPIMAIR